MSEFPYQSYRTGYGTVEIKLKNSEDGQILKSGKIISLESHPCSAGQDGIF